MALVRGMPEEAVSIGAVDDEHIHILAEGMDFTKQAGNGPLPIVFGTPPLPSQF